MKWFLNIQALKVCSTVSVVFGTLLVIVVAGLIVNNCIKFAEEQKDEPTPARIAKDRLIAMKKGGR